MTPFAQPSAGSGRLQYPPRELASFLLAMGGLVLSCAILGLTWFELSPTIDAIARVERRRLPRLDLIQRARYADLDASLAIRNMLLIKDSTLSDAELRRYMDSSRNAATAFEEFQRITRAPEDIALLRSTLEARNALDKLRIQARELDQRGGTESEIDTFTVRIQNALDTYLAASQRLGDYEGARLTSLIEELSVRAGRARLGLIASGIASALTLLIMGLSFRSEMRRQVKRRDEQIVTLRAQRDALVREVHHRIKNHLQGLLVLLEPYRYEKKAQSPEDAVATLQGHVLALVGVHGLQSKDSSERVTLKDLVRQQVELIRAGFPATQLAVVEDDSLESAVLSADQAVPIALAVTELLVNAVKHGAQAPIRVSIGTDQRQSFVSVTNRLLAPTTLDIPKRHGLGNGLSLATTLSQDIAQFDQKTTSGNLTVTLKMNSPPTHLPGG
jgi:two-component sensor histidine kinase